MNKELFARAVRVTFISMEAGRERRTTRTLPCHSDNAASIDEAVNAYTALHENSNATYLLREDYSIS